MKFRVQMSCLVTNKKTEWRIVKALTSIMMVMISSILAMTINKFSYGRKVETIRLSVELALIKPNTCTEVLATTRCGLIMRMVQKKQKTTRTSCMVVTVMTG